MSPESKHELWWTVALEAALFFSIPNWFLTIDPAWLGGDSGQFALSLLIGASSAFVLCHLAPAVCAPTLELIWRNQPGRALLSLLGIWFCLGAAVALFELTELTGSNIVLWQDLPLRAHHEAWRWVARFVAAVGMTVAFVAAVVPRVSRIVASVSLGIGIGLALISMLAQYAALNSVNPYMGSEQGLGDRHSKVALGMLLASAPAAILGLRVGRMRLSLRKIVLTGCWGVWLPLLVSVTLVSVAKMCGVRLYWKPSLPFDFTWAFVWMVAGSDNAAAFLWPVSATFAAPLVVLATWIIDIGRNWPWTWQKVSALALVGAGGYWLRSPYLWQSVSRSWLWSIVLASALLSAVHLLVRIHRRCAHEG